MGRMHCYFLLLFFSAMATTRERGYCSNIRDNLCKPFVSIFLPGLKDKRLC